MDATHVLAPVPPKSRRAVATSPRVAIPIDELADSLAHDNDPTRWNQFVVAFIAGTNVVAVVAPVGISSVFRMRGEVTHRSDTHGFTVRATGGLRGHGLHLAHEIVLEPAGSLHTMIRLATTWRGPVGPFVNRRRVEEWHTAEVDALQTRTERKHPRRVPTAPDVGSRLSSDRGQRTRPRGNGPRVSTS